MAPLQLCHGHTQLVWKEAFLAHSPARLHPVILVVGLVGVALLSATTWTEVQHRVECRTTRAATTVWLQAQDVRR